MIASSGAYDAGTFHAIHGVRACAATFSLKKLRPPTARRDGDSPDEEAFP
jgi:hypothetical protein